MGDGTPKLIMMAAFTAVSKRELEVMLELGCDGVIIGLDWEDDDKRGVDRSDRRDRWRNKVKSGDLDDSIKRCQDAGLAVGVHYWLRPVDPWDSDAYRFIAALAARHRLDMVMADAEKHALKMAPDGGLSFEEWLEQVWAPRWLTHPVAPMAAAVYGYPDKGGRSLALAQLVDRILLMSYAPRWQTSHPGQLTASCADRWSTLLGGPDKLIGGVGVYDMARPGYTESEAIVSAGKGYLNKGVSELAIWSVDFLEKRTKTHRARRAAVLDLVHGPTSVERTPLPKVLDLIEPLDDEVTS